MNFAKISVLGLIFIFQTVAFGDEAVELPNDPEQLHIQVILGQKVVSHVTLSRGKKILVSAHYTLDSFGNKVLITREGGFEPGSPKFDVQKTAITILAPHSSEADYYTVTQIDRHGSMKQAINHKGSDEDILLAAEWRLPGFEYGPENNYLRHVITRSLISVPLTARYQTKELKRFCEEIAGGVTIKAGEHKLFDALKSIAIGNPTRLLKLADADAPGPDELAANSAHFRFGPACSTKDKSQWIDLRVILGR